MSVGFKNDKESAIEVDVLIVSIVVITYNHVSFIDECLRSCVMQEQDVANLEIIVADDGSNDGSPEKIKEWARNYPLLIRPILADVNSGIAENLNRGLRAARGEYIAWLGGDDIMMPGKILRQIEHLERHPLAAGCYHDAEVFTWPSNQILGLFSSLYAGKAAYVTHIDAKRMLSPKFQMLPSTVMVRRRCLPNGYDTRLRFHNDYLFDIESIIKGGSYVRLEGVFTRYRKHEKSIGLDPVTRSSMLEENLITLSILEARYPALAPQINQRAIYYLSLAAIRCRQIGEIEKSRGICRAIFERGAWFRAIVLFFASGVLMRLADPKYRRFAIKLRTLFS
jgi:glycosyltransferase involved in cell wall biosynthesis